MSTNTIKPDTRLGLSRTETAEYIGISATLFDEFVRDGRMPALRAGNARRVWCRREVEAAFDKLSVAAEYTTAT